MSRPDEMLTSDELDAAAVPPPTAVPAEWAVAALKAGKHVLCEKRLTLPRSTRRGLFDTEFARVGRRRAGRPRVLSEL